MTQKLFLESISTIKANTQITEIEKNLIDEVKNRYKEIKIKTEISAILLNNKQDESQSINRINEKTYYYIGMSIYVDLHSLITEFNYLSAKKDKNHQLLLKKTYNFTFFYSNIFSIEGQENKKVKIWHRSPKTMLVL